MHHRTLELAAAVDPGSGLVTVNLFDGTRRPMQSGKQILMTVRDGTQNQLYRDYLPAPEISLKPPFHNNFADKYSVVAWADEFEQAGFQPVAVSPNTPQQLDLMLLGKNATFHFAQAKWKDVVAERPLLAGIFEASTAEPEAAYGQIMEEHPDHLACLLNITTAMQQIFLPQGTPLDYFKQFDLAKLAADRIFGYADATLVQQVRQAAQQGDLRQSPPSIWVCMATPRVASSKSSLGKRTCN